ncbi:glycoside hydrolase family 32 protein [Antribacter sp. KLBMP9083]|uniref:beta-fructofuranosidase n=1 Tax=Antribacter soli TaxID=2910976 RepID=A0AA41QFC0_9MICO|nr:glycoside hydrolase family 32 protein [Antribacter soli]MCF4121059.1 glycoside hydrolase family 32 protein [Antribacter soli]
MSEPTVGTARRADDRMVERAQADPHRPRFHFVSPAGWLNDPNGLGLWDGTYHLFYQYNPYSPVHDRIHWGHATSTDLVRWTDEPVALVPGETGPDVEGCWSGVLVDDGGTPTIVYSGRHDGRELPCVATGSSDLRAWTPVEENPVIAATPPGVDVTAFRDHCVWREDGRWRQLVGSGIRGRGGAAFLYDSTDLRSWEYVGPLVVGDASIGEAGEPDWTGTMWECVDLFRLTAQDAARDVLVFSAWDEGVTHHPLYWIGAYEGDVFTPHRLGRLDYGGRHFYAPQTFQDVQGRRLVFGWLQEGRPDAASLLAGWSGVMSLPRHVTLAPDGTLAQEPAAEVSLLRRGGIRTVPGRLSAGERRVVAITGDQLDLEIDVVLTAGSSLELDVRAAGPVDDAAGERTRLLLERDGGGAIMLRLDRSRSSLDAAVDATPRSGEVPTEPDGAVRLRVIVDHSALEVFANGRPLTARIYPTRPDATGVELAASSGAVTVTRLESWHMADAWDHRSRELWPGTP